MTQNAHGGPRDKSCPRCSIIVAPTEIVADVLVRYDCPSCDDYFVDVCQGSCVECTRRKVACGDCSSCMFRILPESFVGADDVVTEPSPTFKCLRLRSGDFFLRRRVYIVIDGEQHEITLDIDVIL